MSRLYAWINSDTNQRAKTITGNEEIEISVNWGSQGDSKRAGRICVIWDNDTDKPQVYFNGYVGDE